MTMSSPADTSRTENARRWITQFDPAIVLSDADGQMWVTDKRRVHRVPERFQPILSGVISPTDGPLRVQWLAHGLSPTISPGPAWRLDNVMRWLPTSARLKLCAIDQRADQVRFVTGDLETIRMSLGYYRFASEWGVRSWRGRGPLMPVFGQGEGPTTIAVIMPLAVPRAPGLRPA